MSRTRNQRRRRLFDTIFRLLYMLLLIVCVIMICQHCRDIRDIKEKIGSTNITIVAADTFLPEGFSAQSAAYQAALQRYEIEQGHVLPENFEQKEAAPESANSEADRCKGAS